MSAYSQSNSLAGMASSGERSHTISQGSLTSLFQCITISLSIAAAKGRLMNQLMGGLLWCGSKRLSSECSID